VRISRNAFTEQPGQHRWYFAVVVRSDGIEFAHHALLLETARVRKGSDRKKAGHGLKIQLKQKKPCK